MNRQGPEFGRRLFLEAAAVVLLAPNLLTVRTAAAQPLSAVNIVDPTEIPGPALGRMSVSWGGLKPSNPAESIRRALGNYGELIIRLGRRDVDPLGYFDQKLDRDADKPDIADRGFCPGAPKFAIWGPQVEGRGVRTFKGLSFNEFDQKAIGSWAYLGLAPVKNRDFSWDGKIITPRQFHTLNSELRDKNTPYSLDTSLSASGQPWMRPVFATQFWAEGNIVKGQVGVAEYDRSGEGSAFTSFNIGFSYRLNVDDPDDQGAWINQGNWNYGNLRGKIVGGLQINSDFSQVSAVYGDQRKKAVDLEVAGLVYGTKIIQE